MDEAVLFFTFSPIQSFISEARRAEDLFNGSAILAELAKSAALAIGEENLIYPAPPLQGDTPNVIVASVPFNQAESIGNNARSELYNHWREISKLAKESMRIPEDDLWREIWERQTNPEYLWEVYWAAAPVNNGGYPEAYRQAQRAVDALKRSRLFIQAEEAGQKDSLSGKRAALLTGEHKKARNYWAKVSELPGIWPSRIRPAGRERLDSIGAIKRFYERKDRPFPSTSTVAASDYLEEIKKKSLTELHAYRDKLNKKFGKALFRPRQQDRDWPYDGDLLYSTQLSVDRFQEEYGIKVDETTLRSCRDQLNQLYKTSGTTPSPYYAILVLDGDSMGKKIDEMLSQPNAREAHRQFSKKIGEFSAQVKSVVNQSGSYLVYNGGDDVLCMSPLSKAISLARALANSFSNVMDSGNGKIPIAITSSAGIAITHHQSPLDYAIESARQAEVSAKNNAGRNAICVKLLKRGGVPLTIHSKWEDLESIFDPLLDVFKSGQQSSRFAYSVQVDAPVLSGQEEEPRQAALTYLLSRHSEQGFSGTANWAERLTKWAGVLDDWLPLGEDGMKPGVMEVAGWLIFTNFLATGGGE
jgi:CRISPR-associated protein Cmr2